MDLAGEGDGQTAHRLQHGTPSPLLRSCAAANRGGWALKPARAAPPAGDPPVSKRAQKKAPAPAPAAPRPRTQQSPPAQPAAPSPTAKPHPTLDRLPRLLRMAAELGQNDPNALFAALQRPRAGERWRRRLRGVAFFAYERRQRKSITTPR